MLDAQQLRRLRSEFPILSTRVQGHPLIYLDNAATTQKPRQVIDAISNFYRRENANVHRAAHALAAAATAQFEGVRDQLALWLNVRPSELVWTRGTTEAINLVAYAFLQPRLKRGDRILLAQSSHHANIVPWQQIARQAGAQIDVVPLDATGDLDQATYRQLLARKPMLVALPQVSNALGTIYPVQQMIREAQAVGAYTLIDGAQALPHFNVDLQQLDADFYAFSGHKLFAPTGIGALYGRASLLQQMPPWQLGGEMIERVSFEHTEFAAPPLRFEAGTPDIAGVIGLGAALSYLQSKQRDQLEQHEQHLLQRAIEGLSTIPGIIQPPSGTQRVSVLSFSHRQIHAQDLATYLDQQGIAVRAGHHCAQPLLQALQLESLARASFAFYNSEQEVDLFVDAVSRAVAPTQRVVGEPPEELITRIYQADHWRERYALLLQLAAITQPTPATLRRPENEVAGCATRVWMQLTKDADGALKLVADADASLLRAVLQLISRQVHGKTPGELDLTAIETSLVQLGFQQHLSRSRANAIPKLLDRLRELLDSH